MLMSVFIILRNILSRENFYRMNLLDSKIDLLIRLYDFLSCIPAHIKLFLHQRLFLRDWVLNNRQMIKNPRYVNLRIMQTLFKKQIKFFMYNFSDQTKMLKSPTMSISLKHNKQVIVRAVKGADDSTDLIIGSSQIIELAEGLSLFAIPKIGILAYPYIMFILAHRERAIRAQSMQIRVDLAKLLNKINGNLRGLQFTVNIQNGLISVKTSPLVTSCLDKEYIAGYFLVMKQRVYPAIIRYLDRILNILNLQHLKFADRKVGGLFLDLEGLVERVCDDWFEDDFKESPPNEKLQKPTTVEFNEVVLFQEQNSTMNQLTPYASRRLFSFIHVYDLSPVGWRFFEGTSSSMFFKKTVEYSEADRLEFGLNSIQKHYEKTKRTQPEAILKGELIMKQARKGYQYQFERERAILRKLRKLSCPYIRQFYESAQRQFSSHIFSKEEKSLDKYLRDFKTIISGQTKLHIITQILLGLKLLKQQGIVYIDLKPENIVVGKNLVCKISNFAYAYHPAVAPGILGFTIPYAAPQVIDNMPYFTSKTDVFSFGIALLEIFYDQIPVKIPPYREDLASKFYFSKDCACMLTLNPERLIKMGHPDLMRLILEIGVKCLKYNQHERPELERMILIFQKATKILQTNF